MAEVIVSSVVEELASVVYQQTEERVRLLLGVDKEVEMLHSNLLSIQAVLHDAEKKQVKDNAVSFWLDDLEKTSYDVKDVLDEWNTMIGRLQVKEVEDASKPLKKVYSIFSYYLCCCRRVVHRYEISVKIKDLNRRLDVIAREKDSFNFSLTEGTANLNSFNFSLTEGTANLKQQMTAFGIDLSEIHGRDHDKDTLVSLLLSESSEGPILPVISIVGMGGIGKTTLARSAFTDDRVDAHFDKKIWVCVSDPFDEIRIAKTILESLQGAVPHLGELETLLQKISQSLEGKKFLLVLDDVWVQDPNRWEQLKYALSRGSNLGSRIVVTTRIVNTARVMGTINTNMISIGMLSPQESWSLFSKIAFSDRPREEVERLEQIGRKIVDKCKGSPLAIKTLGSLLRFKGKIEEWDKVLGSEFWQLEEVDDGLFPHLLLSFYDLPFQLRKCLSYCVIFPKEYMIEKDILIKLWMAQGYLIADKDKDMELLGKEYLENLVMRSFLQDFEKSEYDGSIIRCKMPAIVHDFVQFVTKNECIAIKETSQLLSSLDETRHLMLICSSLPSSVYGMNLQSLLVRKQFGFGIGEGLSKLFDQLIRLRALDLSDCSIEQIQEGIRKLIHLRYLNLSHNVKIENLPETLCDLYNLQTLDVSNCHRLQKLPQGMGKLIHLRYLNLSHNVKIENLPETLCDLDNLQKLDVSNCHRLQKLPHGMGKLINLRHLLNHGTCLSYIPKGIQSLTNLQQLSKFVVCSVEDDKKASALECLAKFNHLRGFLLITGLGNVSELDEINQGKLKDKQNLLGLGLRFDGGRYAEHKNFLEDLQLPPNLGQLMIQYYIGKTMSLNCIMELDKLRVLKLSSCFEFEYLPALAKLSSLESLMIWNMTSVKTVGNEFLDIKSGGTSPSSSSSSIFPKLEHLAIWNMEEWEEWKELDYDISIMPCLRNLKLSMCPKLKKLPNYIIRRMSTLEELEIKRCGVPEQLYRKGTGQHWPKVSRTPEILTMDDSQSSTSFVDFKSEIKMDEMESQTQNEDSKGKMAVNLQTSKSI